MDLKEISFCDRKCHNICSNVYKKKILEDLFNKYQVVITHKHYKNYDNRYRNYVINQPYLISVKSIGNAYYLYLTRDEEGNNICLFIDKKIVKGYEYPRMIYVIYRFENELFSDTLYDGELLKRNEFWTFIINNVGVYKGKSLMYDNLTHKLNIIHNTMENDYIEDGFLSPCPIRIKKYYNYSEIEAFMKEKDHLDFDINGYLLSPLNQNHPTLYFVHHTNKYNDKEKCMNSVKAKVVNEPNYLNKPKQIKENVEKIAYFKIFKTNRFF